MNRFQRDLDNWIMGVNDPNAPFNQNDEEEEELTEEEEEEADAESRMIDE